MNPYQFCCSIKELYSLNRDTIIGELTKDNPFGSDPNTVRSWIEEIYTLKIALNTYKDYEGFIALEYTLPRVGGRIDCVVGLKGILFVMEFKTGDDPNNPDDKSQLEQYVTDLKNFHFESYDLPLVPMWVIPKGNCKKIDVEAPQNNDFIFNLVTVSNNTISQAFDDVFSIDLGPLDPINKANWLNSPYCPTTNIIEAARKLYSEHNVEAINRSDAKGDNLIRTTKSLLDIIEDAKNNHKKYLCMVTGVPGAGKTLIGLSVATLHQDEEKQNRSVYLSGNRPLVIVLQEALTRDACERNKKEIKKNLASIEDKEARSLYKKVNSKKKEEVASKIKQFIQLVPNWRSEYLRGIIVSSNKGDVKLIKDPNYSYHGEGEYFIPYDHVSIYDEAQRAWEAKENSKYIRKKEANLKNFPLDWSEPRFLISCMDRHKDWAVYICLIGNGQDINHGEAGTAEWIRSIKHFKNWEIYAPSDILKDETIKMSISKLENIHFNESLHLSVDLRSIRAESLALFVDYLLKMNVNEAANTLKEITKYPIRLTRNLQKAKQWLKSNSREKERYGILASSKGLRLKPDALSLLPANSGPSQVVPWFLGKKSNIHSSFYMEDVATEFQVQGLEIDWACIAWDADLRIVNGQWEQWKLRGSNWVHVNKDEDKRYQINAYRVILTRARRGMVIYVPEGDNDDHTRKREFYDGVYNYFRDLGIMLLGN